MSSPKAGAARWLVVSMLFTSHALGVELVPVFDLLSARTAQLDSGDGSGLIYHHPDGRMVRADIAGGFPRHGRWWIGEGGVYCFRLEAEVVEQCFTARMKDAVLELSSTRDESTLAFHTLVPGDLRQLLEGTEKDAARCDCRPSRRRGAQDG